MRRPEVNRIPLEALARAESRYAIVARLLTDEIASGRYKVGQRIPTEAQLQQRFDVSRHTVREALRDLKGRGLVVARAGIGTVVRARAPQARYMQGIGTLRELIQFVEATRMQVLKRRTVIADADLAERLRVKPGQQLHEAHVLRFLPGEKLPVAAMQIYVRPEHGDVLGRIDTEGLPVFALIERVHGVRIVEVSQRIVAATLDAAQARVLKSRAGAGALGITRRYTDAQDRLVMASVGLYPGDRFSHETRFRIHSEEGKEATP